MRVTPAIATLCALVATAVTATELNPRDTKCYSGVYILSARGTNQDRNESSLIPIGNKIKEVIPDSFYTEIVYPANFQFILSGLLGIYNVTQQLINYYEACPDSKTVLLGYSQGSAVMNIVLAGANLSAIQNSDLSGFIPFGTDLDGLVLGPINQAIGKNGKTGGVLLHQGHMGLTCVVVAVAMYGDGTNVPSQGYHPACNSCQSNGTLPLRYGQWYDNMQFYANRLLDVCSAHDPICCSTGDNALAHLSYFNDDMIDRTVDFVKQKYEQAVGHSASAVTSSACVTVFPPGPTSSSSGSASASTWGPTTTSTASPTSATAATSSTPTHTGSANRDMPYSGNAIVPFVAAYGIAFAALF